MRITSRESRLSWLFLVYTLPTGKAVERTLIWRKLQKFGAITLRNAGYLLPNTPENRERFEWSAKSIRDGDGSASVLEVGVIDDLSPAQIREQFRQARADDYSGLLEEVKKLDSSAKGTPTQVVRLRRRLEEIAAIDFFESPIRKKVEDALKRVEVPRTENPKVRRKAVSKAEYQGRVWMTRPRPGIDRVSSAWLISRFIDPKATFAFGTELDDGSSKVPFDTFLDEGFGHEGDNCTFETLCVAFSVRDRKVQLIAQAIHDADLDDGKFGRFEGIALNQVLQGWAKQNVKDEELLRRGIDLIEGLYQSIR